MSVCACAPLAERRWVEKPRSLPCCHSFMHDACCHDACCLCHSLARVLDHAPFEQRLRGGHIRRDASLQLGGELCLVWRGATACLDVDHREPARARWNLLEGVFTPQDWPAGADLRARIAGMRLILGHFAAVLGSLAHYVTHLGNARADTHRAGRLLADLFQSAG